jgi:prepilin-type N-terminal cleavage/methylation domain-containing protein
MRNNTRSLVRSQGGFTIVESLIVIAISGALLASAILLVAGQQRRVEFAQAAQDARSVIEQTIAQVSSGHYPDNGNFSCSATGANINFAVSATAGQGTNNRCIFLGRAIQFGNSGNRESYVIHTVAGYQDNDGSLAAAIPELIPEAATFDAARTVGKLHNGINVVGMRYVDGVTSANISTVAFLQSLGEVDTNNNMLSGSQQIMLVPVPSSGTVNTATVTTTVAAAQAQLRNNPPINPDGGVQICLASGGTNRWAQITIGSNGRSLSVTLDYKDTANCW